MLLGLFIIGLSRSILAFSSMILCMSAPQQLIFCISQGDGVFCPGGSAANMYGVSLARFHKFPESKTKGMQGMPAVHIYTSKLVRDEIHMEWLFG